MREILFRGKRMDNGEWIEGAYFPESDPYPATIFHGKHNSLGDYVDPATVGQFTGLLDKNGKRIFENDTVRFKRKFVHGGAGVRIGRIVYDERNARFRISDSDDYICWDIYEVEDIEVVHDNPELLKEGDTDGKERTE